MIWDPGLDSGGWGWGWGKSEPIEEWVVPQDLDWDLGIDLLEGLAHPGVGI